MPAAASAAIYGPDGSSIAEKLPPDQEGLLLADIDLGAIGVAKNAADPAGHYSRPDVTRLLLNKKPLEAGRAFRAAAGQLARRSTRLRAGRPQGNIHRR